MCLLDCIPERLHDRIRFVDCGCWVWVGRQTRNGYGRTYWRGKERVVHRVMWEILIGPIAPGLVLDHVKELCSNRLCCNVDHLEPVTPRENTLRGRAILFQPRARIIS
jgi:hypothetical protein